MLSQVNAQPYSRADWHWRINVAHRFGHAAAAETVRGVLTKLDREGIGGELRVRDAQEGRAEVVQMWGRPESVRRDFRSASKSSRRSVPGRGTRKNDWMTEASWLATILARLISVRVQGRSSWHIASTMPRHLAAVDHGHHQQGPVAEREHQLDLGAGRRVGLRP